MKLAVNVPNFGSFADPRTFAALAVEAEGAGWDGVFVWDHMLVWSGNVVGDPWILMAHAGSAPPTVETSPGSRFA
jgi:alkanesulfonate monooxygenase SsuD/methylene tetrahydromethanopterin reductase-like flavin-dependent oxidoreductase (luciferase family)